MEITREELVAILEKYTQDSIIPKVHDAVRGVATKFDRQLGELKSAPAEQKPEPDESPLRAELEQLRAEIQREREAGLMARRDRELTRIASAKKLRSTNAFQRLFVSEYGSDLREEGEAWYVGDKTLEEAVNDYLKSDEGELLLPPSGVVGTDAKPTEAAPNSKKQDFGDALNNAFSR